MLQRSLAVLAIMALLLAVGQVSANDTVHEGKLVKAGDGKLTMTDKDGKNEHTHIVKPGTPVSSDGKEVHLEDLKEGSRVKVTTKDDAEKTVMKVEAHTRNKEK
jgi:hypothetical protein